MTGREAETFRETLAQYVPETSDFYRNITRVYDLLSETRTRSDGHGITFVVRRNELPSKLDRHLLNARPYNGKIHNIYDHDIVDVAITKREKDLATIVNSNGDIVGANVYLPADDVSYQERHGIEQDISTFMGFDRNEECPGGRTISALCSSESIGDSVAIITLGETSHEGKKGEINFYYCGDRPYNSAGRKMKWHLADPKTVPNAEHKVIEFPQKDSTDSPSAYLSEEKVACY